MVKTYTSDIWVQTSDIQMTYKYIRLNANDIVQVHASDMRATYEYIRMT